MRSREIFRGFAQGEIRLVSASFGTFRVYKALCSDFRLMCQSIKGHGNEWPTWLPYSSTVQPLLVLVSSVLSLLPSYNCGYGAMRMTMSATAVVRRLVSNIRAIVNLVASFSEYTLQLGDVTSVTHTHDPR